MCNLHLLKNLTGAMRRAKGTVVVEEGGPAGLTLVLLGEVGEFTHYGRPTQTGLATYGPGDFFGEETLAGHAAATAVALTDAVVLIIPAEGLTAFLRAEPDFAAEMVRCLGQRLALVQGGYAKAVGRRFPIGAVPKAPLPAQATAAAPKAAAAAPNRAAPAPAPGNEAVPPVTADPAAVRAALGELLYPPEHKEYELPLHVGDRTYLMEKGYTCPVCKHTFRALKVRSSRLVPEGTDRDLRTRYKGVEPLYYDVASCPNCLYSAPDDLFATPDNARAELPAALKTLKARGLSFELERTTESVFAGYYLALQCAPVYLARHPLTVPNLLMKLYRLYQDCADPVMEELTAQRALETHLAVYQSIELTPGQEQQIQLLLAELSLRLGNLKDARNFFFHVKSDRAAPPLLRTHAENRIMDIRTATAQNADET